ncbi:MAG: serine/threonine-protein kinase [bacterium]
MDAPTWQMIEAVFLEALDLEPEERSAFVEARCVERPDVGGEVLAMLDSHVRSELRVERLLGDSPDTDPLDLSGQRIGAWRLERLLGRGGMGEVWLAERDDEFHQKAAVKLVRPGWRAAELVSRFRHERQILARLRHPHIATLLDGGVASDGRPWLAMEYVDGAPINRWCTERHVSLRDRLRLFLKVCEAVQFAHGNLVVHRDLKPANILVTAEGRPVLLDFGIAKMLDPDDTSAALHATRPGERILTPGNAAPEQTRGEPPTTATDVWALGVLLYELLSGEPPFAAEGRSPEETERRVREADPAAPSSRAPAPDARWIRGDLDAIVATALRKEPERRYGSVDQLSEDIGRWLTGMPVRARPDSLSYRTRKFLSRHRLPVAAGALLLGTLLAFAIVSTRQADRIADERDRAHAERERSEQVLQILVDLFEQANPELHAGGDSLRIADILTMGEDKLAGLDDQPAVQYRLYETFAAIHGARGRYEEARAALRQALAAAERAGLEDAVLTDRHQIARVTHTLEGKDVAAPLFLESLRAFEARYGPTHPDVAAALVDYASAIPDPEEQLALIERSLAIRRSQSPVDSMGLASSLNELGRLRWDRGDADSARAAMTEALRILTAQLWPDHPAVLTVSLNLAQCASRIGDFEEAERRQLAVLEGRIRVFGDGTSPVAASHQALGIVRASRGNFADAERHLRAAWDIQSRTFTRPHPELANTTRNLGIVLFRAGKVEEGAEFLDQAAEDAEMLHGADSPNAAYLRVQKVGCQLGRGDSARSVLPEIAILEESAASEYRGDAWFAEGLRELHFGSADSAVACFARADSLRSFKTAATHPRRFEAPLARAAAEVAAGRPATARRADLKRDWEEYRKWGMAATWLEAEIARRLHLD